MDTCSFQLEVLSSKLQWYAIEQCSSVFEQHLLHTYQQSDRSIRCQWRSYPRSDQCQWAGQWLTIPKSPNLYTYKVSKGNILYTFPTNQTYKVVRDILSEVIMKQVVPPVLLVCLAAILIICQGRLLVDPAQVSNSYDFVIIGGLLLLADNHCHYDESG